jgi:hypothetical protein
LEQRIQLEALKLSASPDQLHRETDENFHLSLLNRYLSTLKKKYFLDAQKYHTHPSRHNYFVTLPHPVHHQQTKTSFQPFNLISI